MLRFLKMTFFTGVPFGLFMGLFLSFKNGISLGIGLGLASGLSFGLLLAAFATWQGSRFERKAPSLDGEQLLKQGPANHFRGWEGVGGWLYLTNKRLLFLSHSVNIQNHALSMPLTEIEEIQTCSTAWIIPNGLRIVTAQGVERFVVEGRRRWLEEVSQAKA